MIDSRLRGNVQPAFDWAGKLFMCYKINPHAITIMAFITGIAAAIGISAGRPYLGIFFLWLSGFFDALDGTVARLSGNSSKIGAYADLVSDRMVEAFVILGFSWFLPSNIYAYLLFFVAVIFNFSTFIVAGALFKNSSHKSMHYDVGIAERTETFIVFTLMALFTSYTFQILMLFNAVIFMTGMIRFFKVIKFSQMEDHN